MFFLRRYSSISISLSPFPSVNDSKPIPEFSSAAPWARNPISASTVWATPKVIKDVEVEVEVEDPRKL